MNENENDSSKKKKPKQQGTLDWFVKKTKREEDASSSSPFGSSTHSKNNLNNENQETEMGTLSDSDGSQSCENESPFERVFHSQFDELMALIGYCSVKKHRHPLVAPLLCVRFLLCQGVEIHGPGYDGSDNKGDLAGLLEMLAAFDENVNEAVINNAPLIERDLINACSKATTNSIVKDIGGDCFAILVGKYYDNNEDMVIALCVRYVDKAGDVVERFLGIMNVIEGDDKALSLKNAVYALLEKHSLSSSSIRGQGYDGVSIMKGDFSGLQNLIKKEIQSAYYTHRFAIHLQITLAQISQEGNEHVAMFFYYLEDLVKVILVSWKENNLLTESHFQKVNQAFEDFATETGTCSDKKSRVGRLNDDTCLGPYYKLISNVVDFYPVILEMVDAVANESPFSPLHRDRIGHSPILSSCGGSRIEDFEFVFSAHLMKTLFEVTNELSSVLQKKDENIVTAMSLVNLSKERLRVIRDNGWETLLNSVVTFCNKNDIEVPNMEDMYNKYPFRKNREEQKITKLHHFQVDVFFATIDLHLQELNSRFDEVVMELLVCMCSLSPIDSFCSFEKQKLLRLAEFYPNEFSSIDLLRLNDQLDKYIDDVRKDERFMGLKDIKELSKKLVEVKKHEEYNLVYLLIKLMLILPVATASVERASKVMTYVKKELRNGVSDELLNDRLVAYVEGEVHCKIHNDEIIKNFESSKTSQEKM